MNENNDPTFPEMDNERYETLAQGLDIPQLFHYQKSRYVVGAESEFPNGDRSMVFLGHTGAEFIWVTDCNASNVCFEEDLVAMKHLVFEATKHNNSSGGDRSSVSNTTVRPYMLTATLHECYDSYLSQVKEAIDKEMFEKFDKMLSENFNTDERNRIMSKYMSQV